MMQDEVKQFQRRVLPEIVLSNIVTVGVFVVGLLDYFPWKVVGSRGQRHLSFKDRVTFTLQLAFVDLIPLIICMFAVFNRRRQTWAINPMDPRGEPFIKRLKGILENTFEQFVIKFVLSMILCTVLRSDELLLLPAFTFLFLLGRLTFALGYPLHRSFGMAMNFLSLILVAGLIAYRLLFQGTFFNPVQKSLSSR